MSSAILIACFPMLVPPYFCTSHWEDGSMVFWCIFGGVRGGGVPEDEEELEGGSDIFFPCDIREQQKFVCCVRHSGKNE